MRNCPVYPSVNKTLVFDPATRVRVLLVVRVKVSVPLVPSSSAIVLVAKEASFHSEFNRLIRRQQFFPEGVVEQHLLEKVLVLFCRLRLVGVERQAEIESCPLGIFAFGLNFAAVMMDDEVAAHEVDAVFDEIGRAHV